jgi:hypothetical protein
LNNDVVCCGPWRHVDIARLFSQPAVKARLTHQEVTNKLPTGPVVYIVRIGKHLKIGFSASFIFIALS